MKWNCVMVINVNQTENREPTSRWTARCNLHHDSTTQVANVNRTENTHKRIVRCIFNQIKFVFFLPMYCAQNLFASKWCSIKINGLASVDIAIGPRKVRGTTPGNSWWSYWNCKHIIWSAEEIASTSLNIKHLPVIYSFHDTKCHEWLECWNFLRLLWMVCKVDEQLQWKRLEHPYGFDKM